MAITTTNFDLKQGSQFQIIITVWEDFVDGTLKTLNIADVFRMQLREKIGDAATILSLTSIASAGITFNTGTSEVTVTITAVQAAAITEKYMVYDLEYVPLADDDDAVRYLQGTFTLSKEVTR